MKNIFFFILVVLPFSLLAQIELSGQTAGKNKIGDSQTKSDTIKPPISAYKIISIENDTIHVDTSLTIRDYYHFNYLRQDNIELLPFSNVARPYNHLAYTFETEDLFPGFVAQARHFNFMEVEDIQYYHVPTPLTELFFKTVFEQGQILDALFTVNTAKNFNFSLAYKGVRSLGKYQHILTSSGNFRATVNYHTKNDRYHLKAHFVSQDLNSQENGGLTLMAVQQYIAKNEEFFDRSRLDVNFEDAENTLFGKRFFLKHSYQFLNPADTLNKNSLKLGHIFNFSDKEYLFEQATASPLFGPAYENVDLHDEVSLETLHNELFVKFGNDDLGEITGKIGLNNYNYGYNSVIILENERVRNRLVGDVFSAGGEYIGNLGNLVFSAEAILNFSDTFSGNKLEASLAYEFDEENILSVAIKNHSRAPNFNFLLYQSDYINYNWDTNFSNVETKMLEVNLISDWLPSVEANFSRINNYTYFGIGADSLVEPRQHSGTVNYFKLKAQKEFKWGQFALNNSIIYQKVLDGEQVLRVPDLVARSTIYFSDYWFQKALYLQTGFSLNYFTDYKMNGYDPVLAEFYVQNKQTFEGFPAVNFFFNSKIRQARIFLQLEHVNSLITGNNYFAAPKYPYRDFAVRFGLVWNFFM